MKAPSLIAPLLVVYVLTMSLLPIGDISTHSIQILSPFTHLQYIMFLIWLFSTQKADLL